MTPRVRGALGGAWRHTTRAHRHVFGPADATGRAPHVRMDVDLAGRQRTLLAALLPCAAAGVVCTGFRVATAAAGAALPGWRGDVLGALGVPADTGSIGTCAAYGIVLLVPLLAASAAGAAASTWAFARARGRDVPPGTAATVLVFALLLPPGTAPWQAALAAAFGIVLGREVFGGIGRTFVHPAVVGLVFLQVTFPSAAGGTGGPLAFALPDALAQASAGGVDALQAAGISWWDAVVGLDGGRLGDASALACVLGAALLLHRRAASWRVMAGALAGVAAATLLLRGGPAFPGVPCTWHVALGSLAFVVVFVATDPGSSAHTNAGRWLHGALVGALAIVIRVASPVHVEGALLAALLASVLVPLVDHAVVRRHVARRRRRA